MNRITPRDIARLRSNLNAPSIILPERWIEQPCQQQQGHFIMGVVGGGAAFDAAASALFARMTTQPSSGRKTSINNLIVALKTAGLWTKLDVLHIYAAADAQAARLNWKSTSFNATLVGSQTFTTDRGYSGSNGTNCLSTGFSSNTTGGAYSQNDAHASIWSISTGPPSGIGGYDMYDDGGGATPVSALYTSTFDLRNISGVNGGSQTQTAASGFDGSGFMVASRTASNSAKIYRNGTLWLTDTGASFTDPSVINTARTARTLMMASLGGSLSAADTTAFQTALNSYKTDVGA